MQPHHTYLGESWISVQLEMSFLTVLPAVWSLAVHVGQQQRVYQFLVSFAALCAHASGGGARYNNVA